jgi:hypothetical protein
MAEWRSSRGGRRKLMWNRRLARLENIAQELKNGIEEMNEKK